jgi:hypothetical protein
MSVEIMTKSAVSVTEMARMVGLSRARFYQLVKKGTFPVADQDTSSERPCYLEEKQRQILESRRRNCGVDGKPILFYSRRVDAGQKRATSRPAIGKVRAAVNTYSELIDGLAALNVSINAAQLEPLLNDMYPTGIDGIDQGEVIRAVFLRIRRQNSTGKVG